MIPQYSQGRTLHGSDIGSIDPVRYLQLICLFDKQETEERRLNTLPGKMPVFFKVSIIPETFPVTGIISEGETVVFVGSG